MTIIPKKSRQQIVEERLKSWLSGDPSGVRHAALTLLLQNNDLSIEDIYSHLAKSYQVTYHGVGGMIGLVSSRIGILQGVRDEAKKCRMYRIREKYLPSIRKILAS